MYMNIICEKRYDVSMNEYITAVLCSALLGYLIGAINPSYIISRRKGFDIREKGSGNAGGSNALVIMGKTVGISCMLFDVAKAYICVLLTTTLFRDLPMVFPVTSVALILGHIFPCWLRFRGGKGLACLIGVIGAFSPVVLGGVFLGEIALLAAAQYLCYVPITASAIFPLVYYFETRYLWGSLLFAVVPIIIFLKHRSNLERIRSGTEMRISYLWKKEEECRRVKAAEEKSRITE